MAAAFSSSAPVRMTGKGAPAWGLATLMPDGAVGASALGGRAVVLAQTFAAAHRGRIGSYDAAALGRLCTELERVQEAVTVSYAFSMLRLDAESVAAGHDAPLAESEEVMARVEALVAFVELEWTALDDVHAAELLGDSALGRFAHWLGGARQRRPRRRAEPTEERLVREPAGRAGSWRRLVDAHAPGARDGRTAAPLAEAAGDRALVVPLPVRGPEATAA